MPILSTKLKNMLPADYVCYLSDIAVNAEKLGCSGFITHGNGAVYVNTEPCGSLGFMVRTALDNKDYTGGRNHFVKNKEDLPRLISDLLKQPHVKFWNHICQSYKQYSHY